MRIVFAGTPEFARVALAALHAHAFEIPLVLTQPDRPAGRGMKLQASPVKQFAQKHDWPVAQPRSLRLDGKYPDDAAAAREALLAARPDAMVVAAYGLILPQWVLDLPRLGCLNIHASLLPRWRGAAPIHRAIEAGDERTGVTIMQMDAGLDTGDMLVEESLAIGEDSTAQLHDRLAAQGGRLIVDVLRLAQAGRLQPRPQPAEGITYAHKIEKAEAPIDWALPAAAIARRLRAFDPFPGATTQLGAETLKCWAGHVLQDVLPDATGLPPGTVLRADAAGLAVATGDGVLLLTELQRAGGKRLPAAAVLAGFAIQSGQVLG
ncbi:methionyl-tRNA formyltransferase [Pseudorhodoferax sp. Leaf274]|uniref:methionyl-tRNA formyltransferase n=1 Tax=Pseudorhodoferax sp. Leaf274 TaxID=1736318 RepID=UPI000702FA43|nr:methionyl-tRNA formyltransferase [Pseudorhodoferax sp. Leaf274]KQP49749.1 methionyl-tRNA formyltransferase [Pseudorhodoferax sp. Leaf274]